MSTMRVQTAMLSTIQQLLGAPQGQGKFSIAANIAAPESQPCQQVLQFIALECLVSTYVSIHVNKSVPLPRSGKEQPSK